MNGRDDDDVDVVDAVGRLLFVAHTRPHTICVCSKSEVCVCFHTNLSAIMYCLLDVIRMGIHRIKYSGDFFGLSMPLFEVCDRDIVIFECCSRANIYDCKFNQTW